MGALEPFASASDVQDRWRTLTDAEWQLAEVLVRDASAQVRAEYPDIDTRIGAGLLASENAMIVTANMVKRALIAPSEGVTQDSKTEGPYSFSQSYANALQNLFFIAGDDALLRGYRPRARSIRYC
jgi:hypothetical protein